MKKRILKLRGTARGLMGMVRLVRDPDRLEEVFTIADSLVNDEILADLTAAFAQDPRGARALIVRPRIGKIDLGELRQLPEGTLGRAYAEHMIRNGLDPSAIPTLASDDPYTFVRAHLYEAHDVWHVLTAFGTDVAGELGLQAFGLAQFPSRLAVLLIAGGLLHSVINEFDDRDARMSAIARGWILGKRAQKVFGVAWGEMWNRPLGEIRCELGIDLAALDAQLPMGTHEVPRLLVA
jgi:ubiquinone biosynthesis protein COQ4